MKVALGLAHISESYNARFGDCLTQLVSQSLNAGIELCQSACYREQITFARNKIATKALEAKVDYILYLDDDMIFKPDLLVNLLNDQKDIVGGLTFLRSEPHEPSFYKLNSDEKTYNPIYMWKPKELVECDAIGMAATLIKKEVFEQMYKVSAKEKDVWGFFEGYAEDLNFCNKARHLGFKMFCDTNNLVGHITEKIIGYGDYKAMADEKIISIKKYQAEKKYDE